MVLSLFRYSGNKGPLLKFYKDFRHMGINRVVEPYLGSGAFSLNQEFPALGYEINPDLCEMWKWLRSVSPKELRGLSRLVEDAKRKEEKPDIRSLGLPIGPQTYVKVNVCSVYVGQLSSWKIYPQHQLPVEKTIECLSRLRNIEVRNEPAANYKPQEGDLIFLDPPYVETKGNYKGGWDYGKAYDPAETVALAASTTNPIIFSYGTSALKIFPMYDWREATRKKVPDIRNGGTVDRVEFVCYLNWCEVVNPLGDI